IVVLALLLARQGTTRARVGAAAMLLFVALTPVAVALLERRRRRNVGWIVSRIRRVAPDEAGRAERALSLLNDDGDTRDKGTSGELARLRVTRVIAALPAERMVERARKRGWQLTLAATVVAVVMAGLALSNAWRVLEGANVLLARKGVAPAAMQWLDDLD